MNTLTKSALAALLLAAASPSLAGESLDAFAARHFNNGTDSDQQQTEPGSIARATLISRGGDAGMTLSARAAEHFNSGVRADDYQTVIPASAQPNPALDMAAAQHFNAGASEGDRQSY